jgi:hypothetical protein
MSGFVRNQTFLMGNIWYILHTWLHAK